MKLKARAGSTATAAAAADSSDEDAILEEIWGGPHHWPSSK